MNTLAIELDEILKDTVAGGFLSAFGKRMYFPKGIVAQSAEAKANATRYNATVGTAMHDGQPMYLRDIYGHFDGRLKPNQIFSYAPGGGDAELRDIWKANMIFKNPSLQGKHFSTPLVTAGLTHGISIAARLFTDAGDVVIMPDLFWDNYDLIFTESIGAEVRTFPIYDDRGGFNVDGMLEMVRNLEGDHARILLNFPNNPTGYTPTAAEMEKIRDGLVSAAETGKKIMVITDDAYFGLGYEDDTAEESLFAYLCDAHENIFTIKGDAATKEEMVWGFRIGFLTFNSRNLSLEAYDAINRKCLGAIRCSVSNCDRPGQTLLADAMKNGTSYSDDKKNAKKEMKMRYNALRDALRKYSDNDLLIPYPFNSGYFMSFRTKGPVEELRRHLLDDYHVGVINVMDKALRVAYCSVEKEDMNDLVDVLYRAAADLWG